MKNLIFLLIMAICAESQAQLKVFSPNDINQLIEKGDKKLMIYFDADWCKICQMMEETTFKDPLVIASLNDHLYFVKFGQEFKEDLIIKGQSFNYVPNGTNSGIHEFVQLINDDVSPMEFPSMSLIDLNGNVFYRHHGYLGIEEMRQLINITVTN